MGKILGGLVWSGLSPAGSLKMGAIDRGERKIKERVSKVWILSSVP